MKRVFIIAAVLIAALPMAHATTYLFTTGTANACGDTRGSPPINVWGFDLTSTVGSGTSVSALNGNCTYLSYDSNVGLGVANTYSNITLSSFAVIDFSSPKAHGATTATIDLDDVNSGWTIYGGNTRPVTSGTNPPTGISGLSWITSGSGNKPALVVSIASYSYLAIIAGPTCDLNVLKIDTNDVPEPGTFVMAGMALIALGVGLRKVCKR